MGKECSECPNDASFCSIKRFCGKYLGVVSSCCCFFCFLLLIGRKCAKVYIVRSTYEKMTPMQLLRSPKTQILFQTFIANIFSYQVRTCWKLLGTLRYQVDIPMDIPWKVQKCVTTPWSTFSCHKTLKMDFFHTLCMEAPLVKVKRWN